MNRVSRVIWNDLLPRSPLFSTAAVAELAGIGLPVASRDLGKLEREGVITRITRGLWAVPTHPDFSPYAVVPHLFAEQLGGTASSRRCLMGSNRISEPGTSTSRRLKRRCSIHSTSPLRKGRRFTFLPEIGWPEGLSVSALKRWIRHVDYEPLRVAVLERWERLAQGNRLLFGSPAG